VLLYQEHYTNDFCSGCYHCLREANTIGDF
jgi:hypothetical protein